jgi:hypothetical protein
MLPDVDTTPVLRWQRRLDMRERHSRRKYSLWRHRRSLSETPGATCLQEPRGLVSQMRRFADVPFRRRAMRLVSADSNSRRPRAIYPTSSAAQARSRKPVREGPLTNREHLLCRARRQEAAKDDGARRREDKWVHSRSAGGSPGPCRSDSVSSDSHVV